MKRFTKLIVFSVVVSLMVSAAVSLAAYKEVNSYGNLHWMRGGGPIPAWFFGASGEGVDVSFYGETSGVSVVWDQSADTLELNTATIDGNSTSTIKDETIEGATVTGGIGAVEIKDVSDTLTTSESGLMNVYRPLTAKRTLTLPAASAGLFFDIYVADADSLLLTVASGDSIIDSAGAAYVTQSTVAGTVRVTAIDTTRWAMQYTLGTWTGY